MKKDTRFSIRKLTVGVASIAVASFLTSGTVDAANLSILHSKNEKAAGYNPELPFEPFPPSISYTQPEAPWMQGSLDTELPGDDVEDVTEPRDPNYEDPEAPFAPVEEVNEPSDANYENPEAPFAPVEEDEEVAEPRKPNYEDPEAPFAPVEEDEEVTEPRKPNYENPEAPFAPVEEEETPEEETPETEEDELEVLPGYKVEEVEGADGKRYKRLVPIEEVEEETPETEEDLGFEILPGYKIEEVEGADGKKYKRLVPVERGEEETPEVPGEEETPETPGEEETPEVPGEEETPETEEDELEVLPGYKVEEAIGADGKTYKRLVPIEEETPEVPGDEGTDLVPLTPATEVITLAKPTPLKFQEVEDGTVITAADFVTNKEDFPEGTEFVFIDYKTKEETATKELLVAPNPKTRNEYLVIRANHPDAEKPSDSTRFTVTVKAILATPIEPGYRKTLDTVTYPAPTEEAKTNVSNSRGSIEEDLSQYSKLYAFGLGMISEKAKSESTGAYYQPFVDSARSDQGQTVLAHFLDFYRKANENNDLKLEDLIKNSANKPGGIYETLLSDATNYLNKKYHENDPIPFEDGLTKSEYASNMTQYMLASNSDTNIYKGVVNDLKKEPVYGAYAPRDKAVEAINKVYADMTELLNAGTSAYRTLTGNSEATENDALAAGLDYYRKIANKPEATLNDVIEDLAQFEFSLSGALELAKQYVEGATKLTDVTAHYKEIMGEKTYKYVQDETGKILDGIGEGN